MTHTVVVGHEHGGSGKSTAAMRAGRGDDALDLRERSSFG